MPTPSLRLLAASSILQTSGHALELAALLALLISLTQLLKSLLALSLPLFSAGLLRLHHGADVSDQSLGQLLGATLLGSLRTHGSAGLLGFRGKSEGITRAALESGDLTGDAGGGSSKVAGAKLLG